jgi:RNA polymerase sigma-70 factor, ECF subfamily
VPGAQDWTSDLAAATDPFSATIAAELPALTRLARRVAGDQHEAEGALQDALERAWRARGQLRDQRAAGAWLRSILTRAVIDRQRRRRDTPVGGPDALEAMLPDVAEPGAVIEAAQDESTLRAALRKLSAADRVAVVLHDGEGWPAAEVATLLGASTEATFKRTQRARSRLVSALAVGTASPQCPGTGCEAARAHAHELFDGVLSEADQAAVRAHLDSCPCCPAALQATAGVLAALADQRQPEPIPETIRGRLEELVRSARATA